MMAALGVRNLQGYNRKIKEAAGNGLPIPDPLWNPEENLLNPDASLEPPELEALPFKKTATSQSESARSSPRALEPNSTTREILPGSAACARCLNSLIRERH